MIDERMEIMAAKLHESVDDYLKRELSKELGTLKKELETLKDRLKAFEKVAPIKGERGEPGKDGDSVDPLTVIKLIEDRVEESVKRIQLPQVIKGDPGRDGRDGKDGLNGRDGVDGKNGEIGPKGEPGPKGDAGAKGDSGELGQTGPAGRDGIDGQRGSDGVDGVDGLAGKDGRDGIDGKDGSTGIQGFKGEMGEKGDPGERGPRGDMGLDGMAGRDGAAGARGEAGRDGRDGVTLEDMDVELKEDGRTFAFKWRAGPFVKTKEISLAIPLDEGVYKTGESYVRGSVTTFGGSAFIAKRDTNQTPGQGEDWRMMVKRGRDGNRGDAS